MYSRHLGPQIASSSAKTMISLVVFLIPSTICNRLLAFGTVRTLIRVGSTELVSSWSASFSCRLCLSIMVSSENTTHFQSSMVQCIYCFLTFGASLTMASIRYLEKVPEGAIKQKYTAFLHIFDLQWTGRSYMDFLWMNTFVRVIPSTVHQKNIQMLLHRKSYGVFQPFFTPSESRTWWWVRSRHFTRCWSYSARKCEKISLLVLWILSTRLSKSAI